MDGTETSAPLGELMLPIETLAAFPLGPSRDLMWQGAQLIWKATKGTIIPRLGQLQCFVELQSKDVVYVAATGSGKTLVIAMMLLQHPEWIGITISPLKELQRGQADDLALLGIRCLVVNKETTNDTAFWKDIESNPTKYNNIIVQAESLNATTGRLINLLHSAMGRKRFCFVTVDESHSISTWGRQHMGSPAFRPAWGILGSLIVRHLPNPRVLALTATAPPPILEHIQEVLLLHPDHTTVIRLPLNRSNITYIARPLALSINYMENYKSLVPNPDQLPPSTIVFCDDIPLVLRIAQYAEHLLSPALRSQGVVLPYHGEYSDQYRKQTWAAYKTGKCRILVATSSAGTGCNADITQFTYQVGLCADMTEYLQRSGRIRSLTGVALLLYEAWAKASKAERDAWGALPPKPSKKDNSNPALASRQLKRNRLGKCILDYVNIENDSDPDSSWCRGAHIIKYNGVDDSRTLEPGCACCDGPNCDLPYDLRALTLPPILPSKGATKKPRVPKRPVVQRGELKALVYLWRKQVHEEQGYGGLCQVETLLPESFVDAVVNIRPDTVTLEATMQAVLALDFDEDWVKSLYQVVYDFDHGGWDTIQKRAHAAAERTRQIAAALAAANPQPEAVVHEVGDAPASSNPQKRAAPPIAPQTISPRRSQFTVPPDVSTQNQYATRAQAKRQKKD